METYDNLSGPLGRTPAAEQLRNTAATQEATLEAINKFKENSNEYSAINKEVVDNIDIDSKYWAPNSAVNYYRIDNQYKSPE